MLKKKYSIGVISLLLVFIYAVGMYYSFSNAKSKAGDALYETQMIILEQMEEFIFFTENKGKLNMSVDDAITQFIGESNIPYTVCFFDENDELIASTQDYIYFYDEKADKHYCFIDDYLNDDTRKQIKKAYNSGAIIGECWFYYNEDENGKIIPVTFVFKNPNNNNCIEEIKFTDYDQYSDKDKQFGTFLTVDGEVTKKIQSPIHVVEFEIPYILADKYESKQYSYTLNEIVKDGKLAYNDLPYEDNPYEFRQYVDRCDDVMPVVCNDGAFTMYAVGRVNANLYALSYFKNQAIGMTTVLAIALVVLILSVGYAYKKQQLSNARYDFANAAAHELKTPLAVIQNQCECIMENVNSDNNDNYVRSVYEEALRMNKLVTSLLNFNSLAGKVKLETQKTNISLIAENEIEKYKSSLTAKDLTIISDINADCYAVCNGELIALVIDNFLSNAIKFADDGSDIIVSLSSNEGKARLGVFNKGRGVKANEDELWTILYKEDKSRRSDGSSTGMGLALSGRILELHKYKYGFINRNNGVEFYFIAK